MQFQIEKHKISRRRLRSEDDAELGTIIYRCSFAEDGKEMYKDF